MLARRTALPLRPRQKAYSVAQCPLAPGWIRPSGMHRLAPGAARTLLPLWRALVPGRGPVVGTHKRPFTARSRSSAGCAFRDAMSLNFPRGHGLQEARGGPVGTAIQCCSGSCAPDRHGHGPKAAFTDAVRCHRAPSGFAGAAHPPVPYALRPLRKVTVAGWSQLAIRC